MPVDRATIPAVEYAEADPPSVSAAAGGRHAGHQQSPPVHRPARAASGRLADRQTASHQVSVGSLQRQALIRRRLDRRRCVRPRPLVRACRVTSQPALQVHVWLAALTGAFNARCGLRLQPCRTFLAADDWHARLTGTKSTLNTCDPASERTATKDDPPQPVQEGQEVIYTYDVLFRVRCAEMLVMTNEECLAELRSLPDRAWDSHRLAGADIGAAHLNRSLAYVRSSSARWTSRLGLQHGE